MDFGQPLVIGTLLRRYKRFLADVRMQDGNRVTCHVPNSGSMKSCSDPGLCVALSHQPKSSRKLEWTLELVKVGDTWVGVNTMRTNDIVTEAIEKRRIGPLLGYENLRREVRYGQRSRVDILLERVDERCYVEVKNATLKEGHRALFPDAVTERGAKHLRELHKMVQTGHRAVIFFLVNRSDCTSFGPADEIDPGYGKLLRRVTAKGVEALAYRTRVDPSGIRIERKLPVRL